LSERRLEVLRRHVDELDERLLELLAERLKLASELAEVKKKLGLPVRDEERERKVMEAVRKRARRLGLDPEFAESVLRLTVAQAVGRELERVGAVGMWARVQKAFAGHPARLSVASLLFKYGLRVREDGEIACGEIRIPAVQIAKEAGVDRRVVDATAKTILASEELSKIFSNLQPLAYLKNVARGLGLGVIEILPTDATKPGILSEVSGALARGGISIRQAVADDPYFTPSPKLTIITDEPVWGEVIEALRKLPGVQSVVVY